MRTSTAPARQAVTGAFGFSGSAIARQLLEAGHEVVTLTSSPRRASPLQGRVSVYPFDFTSPKRMAESLAGVDVLYNTYWTRLDQGETTHEQALKNSIILFEAARMAGVRRIVQVSAANADWAPEFSYYRAKSEVDAALRATGISHAIVRPAILFGGKGVFINNLAWVLRHLPVFGMFGDGLYKVQPVYVEDLAALMIKEGAKTENTELYALGPEVFTYVELVDTLGRIIGCPRRVLRVPLWAGVIGAWVLGRLHGDVFASRNELGALMLGILHVPGASPTASTRFSDWAREHADELGRCYMSEMGRRKDKEKGY